MGFRCPACKQDFGLDKAKFLEHIQNCGAAKLHYDYYANHPNFKKMIAEFCGYCDKLKERTDRLGNKAEREAFYAEIEKRNKLDN